MIVRWIAACFLFGLLSATAANTAHTSLSAEERAWLDAHPDLTFCFSDNLPPYLYLDKNRQPVGYLPDFFALLSNHLGTPLKIGVKPWAQAVADAKARGCAGLAMVRNLQSWWSDFLFSDPVLDLYTYIFTRSDQATPIRRLSDLDGKQVAYMTGEAAVQELLVQYPQIRGVPIDRVEDTIIALVNGQVEAIIGTIAVEFQRQRSVNLGVRIAVQIPESKAQSVIAVRKDWPELVAILNKVLGDLSEEEKRALEIRWFGDATRDLQDAKASAPDIKLTDAERAWLAEGHTVRVRVSEWPPYMFTKPAPSGISVDTLNAIAKRLGFKVDYLTATLGWAESVADVRGPRQRYDLLLTMNRTPERERQFALTSDYVSSPWVIFSRKDSPFIGGLEGLSGKTIAAEKGFAVTEKLRSAYPAIHLLEVDRTEEALRAVAAGSADAYVGNLTNATYLIKEHRLDNLMVVAPTPFGNHTNAMAIRKDWPELASLIDKGLAAMPPEERNAISQKWGAVEFKPRIDYTLILWIVAIGGLALLMVLYWNRTLQREIHHRRIIEQTLRLEREKTQSYLDTVQTMIVALDRYGNVTMINRTGCAMLGYTEQELLGKSWFATCLPQPEGMDAVFPVFLQIIAGKSAGEDYFENSVVCKDGRLRLMAWRNASFRNQAGDIVGTLSSGEDITERKQKEAELMQAKSAAESATRAKSEFLANMSHEIRTPMNAIIGMTYLVLKTDLTPPQRDYLLKIQGSSQHLLGIINDILDFSKLDAGKLVVEQINFELERVLDQVASLVAEKMASKGLELIIDVADEVPNTLVGDPLRIGQVLINYANNALKFTEQGEVVISVRVAEQADQDMLLHFAVRDTGIGIRDDQRPLLFQSFQQGDASITREYGGTGLGLVISKRLATLMGGTVGFDSAPGQGTTFWFTARLGKGQEVTTRFLPRPDLRGRRMLVVDDNRYARTVISAKLRSLTFVVTTVASGAEALAELIRAAKAGEPYAIVFLDWRMPGMDGVATAQEIRRLSLSQPLLALMITAYERDELRGVIDLVGIEEILVKPVSLSLLFDTILRMLGSEAVQSSPALGQSPEPLPDLSTLLGRHALLVEDNDLNQEVALAFLQEVGLEVDLAVDGAIALEKVQQRAYDIVLMDMQMPVMDGLTATREIRKLPNRAELPIVAMTANAMVGDRERCLAAGMNDHIAKPIDPNDLIAKLLRWVKPSDQRATLPVDRWRSPPANASHPPAENGLGVRVEGESACLLAGIAGLDVARGLHQALDRDALYLSLIAKFVTEQASARTRIADALMASDWSAAERMAHTLKGVAAQIGASEVRAIAEQLEQAIRHRDPAAMLDKWQSELAGALSVLIEAIRAHLPPEKALPIAPRMENEPGEVDYERWRDRCIQLANDLSNSEFSSRQLLYDNNTLLQAALGDHFPKIAEAIQNYDFDLALDELREAMASQRDYAL